MHSALESSRTYTYSARVSSAINLQSEMNQEKALSTILLTYSNVYLDIKHLFPLT